MDETLKEIAAELAVIREALERAEVSERELRKYHQEVQGEIERLRGEDNAEISKLHRQMESQGAIIRCHLDFEERIMYRLFGEKFGDKSMEDTINAIDAATARATTAEAQLAHWKKQHDLELLSADGLAAQVALLKGVLEQIAAYEGECIDKYTAKLVNATLATTPAAALGRVKAEGAAEKLNEMADSGLNWDAVTLRREAEAVLMEAAQRLREGGRVMREEILMGHKVTLSTGSTVALAKFDKGYALQFTNTIDDIKTEEELAADPTCRCRLVDGAVVTSICFSDEAVDAIVVLRDYLRSKALPPKEVNGG